MFESNHWLVEFVNEWKQIIGKWNWYTFTFIEIYFENDKFTKGYEFQFMLLGLGVRIRYNTEDALKLFDEWGDEIDEEIMKRKNG